MQSEEHSNEEHSNEEDTKTPFNRKRFWLLLLALSTSVIFLGILSRAYDIELVQGRMQRIFQVKNSLEMFYIFILPSILVLIFSFLFGPLILRFYLFIARKLRGSGVEEGVHPYIKEFSASQMLRRTELPTFLALSFGLTLYNASETLDIGYLSDNPIYKIMILTLLTLPFVSLFIFPLWMSEDFGIILYRKEGKGETVPHVSSAGEIIQHILQGYTGISTPFQFILVLLRQAHFSQILQTAFLVIFPFTIFGLFLPTQIIYYYLFSGLKKRVTGRLKLNKIHLQISSD